MKDVVCFYHKDCFDGLSAAYAVYCKYPKAKFIAIHYGEKFDLDQLVGKDVVVVDFSFPLETSMAIIDRAASFTVLDHHKSFAATAEVLTADVVQGTFNIPVTIVFDLHRSGALITWQHFHPDEPVPALTKFVSDRDLYRFEYGDETREIMASVGLVAYTLEDYVQLFETFEQRRDEMRAEGRIILRKNRQDALNIIRTTQRKILLGGKVVPLVNCPYYLASELLAMLAQEHPYAVSYFDTEDERVFSIRSAPGSEHDVEAIAKSHGGGGHKNAAGWRVRRYSNLAQM